MPVRLKLALIFNVVAIAHYCLACVCGFLWWTRALPLLRLLHAPQAFLGSFVASFLAPALPLPAFDSLVWATFVTVCVAVPACVRGAGSCPPAAVHRWPTLAVGFEGAGVLH